MGNYANRNWNQSQENNYYFELKTKQIEQK